jgi:hypothetical protein
MTEQHSPDDYRRVMLERAPRDLEQMRARIADVLDANSALSAPGSACKTVGAKGSVP